MASSAAIRVIDNSHVGEARRLVLRVAQSAGMDEVNSGKAAIIVTELANNLHRYAPGGQLFLQTSPKSQGVAISIWSIDSGPGIANVGQSLQDGFSTGGTPGNGLGAVKRLSSEFDIFSASPGGTVIYSRVQSSNGHIGSNGSPSLTWAALSIPAPGEQICGDDWHLIEGEAGVAVVVADGLGHGPKAAEASSAAVAAFVADPFGPPATLLEGTHRQMTSTRGAAVAVGRLDFLSRTLHYAGVGNIAGAVFSGTQSRGLCSHNGTVGAQFRKAQEFQYPWPENGLLVMHSDGIQTRWALENYPGLATRHPGIIVGILVRDFTRGRDDATAMAVRFPA